MAEHLGHQLLVDCYGCHGALLADVAAVRRLLERATTAFGLTVISSPRRFPPSS